MITVAFLPGVTGTLQNIHFGTEALPTAQVLTVSRVPTGGIGDMFKNGVIMVVSDTITVQEIDDGILTYLNDTGLTTATTMGFDSDTFITTVVVRREVTIQEGRLATITNAQLGTDLLAGATVLTMSESPDIGNLLKNGVAMIVGNTITVDEITAGALTYQNVSSILGTATGSFNAFVHTLDIISVLGRVGKVILFGKALPPDLLLTDQIPREIPPQLADKLAYAIAARVLQRGDRSTDAQRAAFLFARFQEARLDTIANMNKIAGTFRSSTNI